MPRPHLRPALRDLARRLLGGGAERERPAVRPVERHGSGEVLRGLPPLQPGRGETPGPNDKQDISREWASAQVVSGVPPFFLDVRPVEEFRSAHLPGARSLPVAELRGRLAELPGREHRIVVYDRSGGDASGEVAASLRAEGWALARRLVGGFEGWLAYGEPTEADADPGAEG